jgi:imidazolonepropionase
MITDNPTLIIYNASQLLTLSGGPQRGRRLGELGIIENGSIAIEGNKILSIWSGDDLLRIYPDTPALDAEGCVVMPGFVDPHTHLVWAGDRAVEFDLRLQGKSYLEILEDGGGILSTMAATRSATLDELIAQTRKRAWDAFSFGTTTAEVKTGYGLDLDSELKQMQAILALDNEGPLDLVPTFLGAHALPPAYKDNPEGYVDLICSEMLPELSRWWQIHAQGRRLPFVDVFCEKGAFDLTQSRRILETAGSLGFPLKIHADEFENLGGAALAAELGAASADHLVKTSRKDIRALADSNTVAVSLPGTPFGLNEAEFTPAQEIIKADGLLALATDTNPGTSWCESMQFIIALACRKMNLTPAQAIAAATINAAAALKLEDRVGSIEPGKQADLLILDVDDYRHLGYRFGTNLVAKLIKRGLVLTVKRS